MSESIEYFGIKCHECGFIGSSEESHGGGAMADTGDFEELRCPKCEWVTLHEDPRESELCDEIVRLRKIIEALTKPPVVEDKPQGEAIKAAFMEGIAVYELGPCDGKPMSEEQIEKCWDLSDAKEAAKPQGDPEGFVQCQDKGWHKDMGDSYSSECLTKEAAIVGSSFSRCGSKGAKIVLESLLTQFAGVHLSTDEEIKLVFSVIEKDIRLAIKFLEAPTTEAARVPPEAPACPYCNMDALRKAIEAQGKDDN